MTRDQMIAEISKRSAFPFDFASVSDTDLQDFLRDLDEAAASDGDRFSVTSPMQIEERA